MSDRKSKQIAVTVIKVGISAGLLWYLFQKANENSAFDTLSGRPKDWGLLTAGFLCALGAMCITKIRWCLLVRALDLDFAMRDAFKLGFIGYAFNFATVGVVGGDAIKSVYITRQQPERKTEAVASVVIDRLIGVYSLLIVGALACWYMGARSDSFVAANTEAFDKLQNLGKTAAIALLVGGVFGLIVMAIPALTGLQMQTRLGALPKIGGILEKIVRAASLYRSKISVVLFSIVISFGTHVLFTLCAFFVAQGINVEQHPDFIGHLSVVPVANLAGSVPLPGGLGAFEYALNSLYPAVAPEGMAEGQGFVVALGYRVITVLLALIGVACYLSNRREMEELESDVLTDASDASDE